MSIRGLNLGEWGLGTLYGVARSQNSQVLVMASGLTLPLEQTLITIKLTGSLHRQRTSPLYLHIGSEETLLS